MSKQDNLTDFLTDVADAIRTKKGTTEKINPQNFSEEIKNLPSGSSPFAVDFGEEIASGNPAFINALQEDIDYYNEIVRKLNSGEIKESDVFKAPILYDLAWIPPQVTPRNQCVDFWRLRSYKYDGTVYMNNNVSPFLRAYLLESIECQALDRRITSLSFGSDAKPALRIFKIKGDNGLTSVSSMFAYLRLLKVVEIDTKNVLNFQLMWRETRIPKIELDLLSATNVNNMFYSTACDEVYLSNLGISLSMSDLKTLTIESVKFILDHCQDKTDTPYTLTLNAAVKAAFLAKCDEDAEYAASLASANAKGLTLA